MKHRIGTRFIPRVAALMGAAALVSPLVASSQGPYEIVRGKDLAVCRALVENFNAFKDQPPMVCERKVSPTSKGLAIPDWSPMSGEQALQAALALERDLAAKGPTGQAESRYAKAKALVEAAASRGRLKVWESRFDLAGSGEKVRVVLVRNGECRVENNYAYDDPKIGVLADEKSEVVPRYRYLSHVDGDVVLYNGKPYVVVWDLVPTATLSDAPPPKQHRGYALVYPTYSLPANRGGGPKAGLSDAACQIGYQRIKGGGQRRSR